MKFSPLVERLISDLQVMPGVGPRTAQRIAFYLLDHNREGAVKLGETLNEAMNRVSYCPKCHSYSDDGAVCSICSSQKRLATGILCVVESPADVLAIEQTGEFEGTFFVLHGHLSPIDGIGPAELGLDQLTSMLDTGDYHEIILATNPTVEGDTTAHYIAHIASRRNVTATRIARGIPVGGELESIDGSTIMKSLAGRSPL